MVGSACREKIDYLHDFKFSDVNREDTERPFFNVLPFDGSKSQPVDGLVIGRLGDGRGQRFARAIAD